jgi:hypothetical protein
VAGVAVGGFGHDLGDEPIEGIDAGGLLATAEDLCPMNVECRQVGPGAAAGVLMFDAGC